MSRNWFTTISCMLNGSMLLHGVGLSRYMIEQILQEWIQEQLTSQAVMIDRGDELVGGAQSAELSSAAALASASPGFQDHVI